MGRTWLIRGIVVAVVAVLVGAWTVEVSGLRDSDGPSKGTGTPASPEQSDAPELETDTVDRRTKKGPRVRRLAQPEETESPAQPTPDGVPPVDDEPPLAPTPTFPNLPTQTPTATPTPDSPGDVDQPEDPQSTPPTPTPSTPDEPEPTEEACTELFDVLDCLLNPITSQP